MSNVNLKQMLSQKLGDVKPSPHVPAGTWRLRLIGAPKFTKSSKKQTPGYEFTVGLIAPMPDVDEVEAAEFAEFHGGRVETVTKRVSFWLTPDSLSMLTEFLQNVCKIDANLDIQEGLAATTGVEILGTFQKVIVGEGEKARETTRLDTGDLAPVED